MKQHRIVLDLARAAEDTDQIVFYGAAENSQGGVLTVPIMLDRDVWEQLGSPEQVILRVRG